MLAYFNDHPFMFLLLLAVLLAFVFINWPGEKREPKQLAYEIEDATKDIEGHIRTAKNYEHLDSALNMIEIFKGMYGKTYRGMCDYSGLKVLHRLKMEEICPERLSENERHYVGKRGELLMEVQID